MTDKELPVKTKQVVQYVGNATVYLWPWTKEEVYVARLPLALNHPKLGRCYDVRTSRILKQPDESGRFETLNTIYEKVESEDNYANE
jgi:hypothetical protein